MPAKRSPQELYAAGEYKLAAAGVLSRVAAPSLLILSPQSFLSSLRKAALQPGELSPHHAVQNELGQQRSRTKTETKIVRSRQSRDGGGGGWRCEEGGGGRRLQEKAAATAIGRGVGESPGSCAEGCDREEAEPRSGNAAPPSARAHALRQHAEQRTPQPKNDCAIQRAPG
jgi:hypothetical protein